MSTRPATIGPSRNFRSGDIREAILQGLSALSVRVLPPPRWGSASEALTGLFHNNSRSREERFRRSVVAVLGDAREGVAAEIRRQTELQFERRRMYIAALRAGQRWSPTIELSGLDGVSRSPGKGTILWLDHLTHYSVPGKMAFAEAGLPVWQLSSHTHGISATRFGIRFLNPRQIKVENRYLQGRIAFDRSSLVAATRRLVEILGEGGIVAITNTPQFGKFVSIPFGEAASLRVATTPLKLAIQGKAAVLPVSVVETEPLKRYRVTIGPALSIPSAETGDPIAAMLSQYSDHLLALICAYPDQWAEWRAVA